MMTVNEVSMLTGVSIRTLHYYNQIGLLSPAEITHAGYRLYGDKEMERLQQILLFRELEFPLKEISWILNSAEFDRIKALNQQIELLTLKKERLENLIVFAREIKSKGEKNMKFDAFDRSKIDEYTKEAKEQWGKTEAYKEFEKKDKGRSKREYEQMTGGLMDIFAEFGTMMDMAPDSEAVQLQVKKLQGYISDNYYHCTKEILEGLGKMYTADERFAKNIDAAGSKGCARFASEAIEIYCGR